MSQAVGVVERFGYVAEYFPYQPRPARPPEAWSQALRARLNEAIAFYDARCVVFDGNVPYQGLVETRRDNANRPFVWIRRGMWRPEAGRATIDRARHFDLVIEPGEFAAEDDPGITAGRDAEALRVAPVTLFEPASCSAARRPAAELGLDPDRARGHRPAGCPQQFRLWPGRPGRPGTLGSRPRCSSFRRLADRREHGRTCRPTCGACRTSPSRRYLRAFDLAVSACGYNSLSRAAQHRPAGDPGAERESDDGRAGDPGAVGGPARPRGLCPQPRDLSPGLGAGTPAPTRHAARVAQPPRGCRPATARARPAP